MQGKNHTPKYTGKYLNQSECISRDYDKFNKDVIDARPSKSSSIEEGNKWQHSLVTRQKTNVPSGTLLSLYWFLIVIV